MADGPHTFTELAALLNAETVHEQREEIRNLRHENGRLYATNKRMKARLDQVTKLMARLKAKGKT